MKKFKIAYLYLMVVLCLLVCSLVGCSDDEDDLSAYSIVGKWQMIDFNNGWIPIQKVEEGAVMVEFNGNGVMKTTCKDKGPAPFNKNGTRKYAIVEIEKSIFTGKPGRAIKIIDEESPDWSYFFSYSILNDTLVLSQEAYDGWGFALKRQQ